MSLSCCPDFPEAAPNARKGLPSGLEVCACPLISLEDSKAMGLPLLLSLLLLLPASLQAGEWPGHPGSAQGHKGAPGRGCGWVASQGSHPEQAKGWSHSAGSPSPLTLLLPQFWRGGPPARGPVLPSVTLLPVGEGASWSGVIFSTPTPLSTLRSLSPSFRSLHKMQFKVWL